jgi:integrase
MASIETKRDANGRAIQYRARYRTPDGKSRGRNFTTLAKARSFLATVEHDKSDGSFVDPMAGRTTVAEFAAEWMALKVWATATRDLNENLWRVHVEPSIGSMALGAVRRSHLQAVINRSTLAPSSKVTLRTFVTQLFRTAELDRLIAVSPATKLEVPMIEGGEIEALEPDEVAALIAAVPERYTALFTLTAATGLRLGEATGLTVPSVGFLRRTLKVERQLVSPNGAPSHLTTRLKGKRSYRTIPMSAGVLDVVARHLEVYGPGPDDVVFTDGHRNYITRRQVATVTAAATRRAGVDATFHSLRHYAASRFLSHGVSVKATAQILGHSPAELLRTYAHFVADDEDRVRAVMADGEATSCVTRVSRASTQ